MYSLYRAWLSLGPALQPPPPPNDACTSTQHQQPDVLLQVGPALTQFSAHKNILSAHSGFFKAIFTNHTGTSPIPVPNINVDEFSSLLTFMYTGYLDLNFGNIYNILLATHILHMPAALEICRSFLLQNNPLEARTSIIKPIPSRKSILPHPQQIYAPLFGNLPKSDVTPFREIAKEQTNEPETEKKAPEKTRCKKRDEPGAEKVIVDIACCDGPVRFHRVLNKNYGTKNAADAAPCPYVEVDRNVILNKVMNENIRDKQQSQNENQDLFTCVYCNHTFKSQYCYQKHARRHLNPVTLEVKTIQKIENVVSSKREVKLLDMNVQYYPCKTCGSKFPSYYFVHKHRKMCHAEEIATENQTEDDSMKACDSNSVGSDAKNNDESEIEVGNDNV
ncbi:hypothetical protein FQR65_LT14759 [Abscondita terminalis]|nr:hypothetical protein FQR65_LT14759 [Abscondita terminalis]